MKCRTFAIRAAVSSAVLFSLGHGPALSQTMDQYYAVPPFVTDQVVPNILLLLDNSGSMADRACDPTWCGVLAGGGTTPVNRNFVETTTYSGFFDPMSCYTYDATNTRFDYSSTKATLSANCGGSEWDGNFINWAGFRRFDALKKAMSGGDCVVTRAADGSCPASGSPSKITNTAQALFLNSGDGHFTTNSIPKNAVAGASSYVGRVPGTATPGNPNNIWIHLRGGTSGMAGSLCVDDDGTAPASNATTCTDADGFAESNYKMRFSSTVEPTGVVQQIGPQARFGLFEFKGTGDGARMLVGIGARQSIDFGGATVETFNTNTAAILDALSESSPSTWTPLSESLYEASRYLAQINSTFLSTAYVYPIAYSGGNSNGVAFATTGVGSIGPSEISALTGTETCPAGYITNACGRDPYFFGSNHTPPWATTSTQVTCCKTYVLIVTDGEPTQDTNVPAGIQDYAHGHHGVHCTGSDTSSPTAPINTTCNAHPATQAPYLIGTNPSATGTSGEHKTDYGSSGNHYLDDVAFWAHTNDLRPCNGTADGTIAVLNVTGHCLAGFQNITLYTFFAFGNIAGRELLMHSAQLGGFEDSNGNNLPDLTSEWDNVVNATGAPGSDGVPDNYFESSDVNDLQDRLMATVTAIIRKSASGTSVSVLSSSASGEGSIYQAYFFTSDVGQGGANVKWTGYTHGLFVDGFGNFREDTVQDGVLDYKTDLIVTTRFDNNPASPTYKKVLVDKYVDLNGDGQADTPTTPTILGADLKTIKPIWEAGNRLANTSPASRTIKTWIDTNNNGLVDGGEQIDFNTANCSALRDYLRYAGDACSGSTNAMNLIDFIRGTEIAGLRTRMLEVPVGSGTYKVWKLGDPIHSTPTVVAAPRSRYDVLYGDASYNTFFQQYRNRREVVYIGANDGMLHAFNGGYYHKGDDPSTTMVVEHGWFTKNPTDNSSGAALGDELWGFIPYQLLPQLQWLARSDYTHVYYVDLKPTVEDVRIFTPDADHPGGWGTILIGGFRLGGSCGNCGTGSGAPPMTATIGGTSRTFYSAYFVLDITNPEVPPKLLWSFTDSNLGLTTSAPAVVRMNPSGDAVTSSVNEKWYAVFGSGPNGYQADLPTIPGPPVKTQTASLYVIDLVAGPGAANANVTRMSVGSWTSFMGHLVAIDKNLDFTTDAIYVGRTLNDGSLPWRGKMYRLSMSCSAAPCLPTSWGIASGGNRIPTEIIDTFTNASGSTIEMGPITTAPALTVDDSNQVWVFWGTGRYLSNADKIDNSIQSLFGIKDSVVNGTCTQSSATSCWDNNLVDATNAVVCLVCSAGTNQVTDPNNAGVTTVNGTGTTSMVGLVQSKDGWRVTLPGPYTTTSGGVTTNYSAERSIVTPTVFGGTVFFPTFAPTSDFCGSDGTSNLYALFYKTGTAGTTPVIGTSVQGSNTNVTTKISLGVGAASSLSVHVGLEGASLFTQMSNSNFITQGAALGDFYSRYTSWIHQRD
jgi:type IV pilus assembly protein PilY1